MANAWPLGTLALCRCWQVGFSVSFCRAVVAWSHVSPATDVMVTEPLAYLTLTVSPGFTGVPSFGVLPITVFARRTR